MKAHVGNAAHLPDSCHRGKRRQGEAQMDACDENVAYHRQQQVCVSGALIQMLEEYFGPTAVDQDFRVSQAIHERVR